MTFWGFDDDGEDWYADGAKKKADDDDEHGATGSSSSSRTSDGPLVDGAGLTVGCVLVAGILIGAAAMRLRQSSKRRPPTVELGQVIVAEEVLKDLEPTRTDLQEPFPSVDASTPTATCRETRPVFETTTRHARNAAARRSRSIFPESDAGTWHLATRSAAKRGTLWRCACHFDGYTTTPCDSAMAA